MIREAITSNDLQDELRRQGACRRAVPEERALGRAQMGETRCPQRFAKRYHRQLLEARGVRKQEAKNSPNLRRTRPTDICSGSNRLNGMQTIKSIHKQEHYQ